jgi:diamine N-acetyltransferase
MPPWSVMQYRAPAMTRFFQAFDAGASRYLVAVDGKEAGAVSVRFPFLKGPYLELLALLPDFQGRGLGGDLIAWFEREAVRREARNLWVCASSFNARALSFYERHGFRGVATLPGLVAEGYDEILLRKGPLESGG